MKNFIILSITVAALLLVVVSVTAQDTIIDDTIVYGTVDQMTDVYISLKPTSSFDCETCNQYDFIFEIDNNKYSYTYNKLKRLILNDQELREFTIPADPAKIPRCVNVLYSLGWRGGVVTDDEGNCDIVVSPLK